MDIKEALLIKSLGELLIITACLTSEKLRRILRSHKIRSTFHTEMTLHKLLCKPKDRVATED